MNVTTMRNEKQMNLISVTRIHLGSRGAMIAGLLLVLSLGGLFLTPVQADLLDVYESDGTLQDLIVFEGDSVG